MLGLINTVHGTHLLGISELGGVCDFLCFLLECIFLFWSAPLDQNKRLEKPQPALTHEPWAVQSPSSYSDGLVRSESCHVPVAAVALGGFSQPAPGAAESRRGSPGSGCARSCGAGGG